LQTAYQRRIRNDLHNAVESKKKDPVPLKTAITKFENVGLADTGDYSKAQNKLDYLTLKKGMI
jgi:hypothetical protein